MLSIGILSGCGAGHGTRMAVADRLPRHKPHPPVRARDASLVIGTPKPGEAVGSAFTVRVRIAGFTLQRPQIGATPLPSNGYLEFSLDHGRFDERGYSAGAALSERLAVNGTYTPAFKPELSYRHIPPGRHSLVVGLLNRDGTPAGPSRTVAFFVR